MDEIITPAVQEEDLIHMRRALALAEEAAAQDEVPVGALIVHHGKIIAEAYNPRETSKCATHHAEVLVIEAACRALGGWRLPDCALYVPLEPCPMCAGAIVNSSIDRVVYAAPDLRAGAFGSVVDLNALPLNHKPLITPGVCGEESKSILSAYFRAKRKKKAQE